MSEICIDVVVVGGGAAGLSAALMLSRARRSVTVIDNASPRNLASPHLHGFLSQDGAAPAEFLAAGRTEVESYGGQVSNGVVESLDVGENGLVHVTWSGGTVRCRTVVVATGLSDHLPAILGISDLWGTHVFHCPYCHGHEVELEPVAVIGGDNRNFSVKQAGLLTQWSDHVTFFLNGIVLDPEEESQLGKLGVDVDDSPVLAVNAVESHRVSVVHKEGRERVFGAAFVGPVFVPNDRLLRQAGCDVSPNGFTEVDESGRTSVPQLWSAGNVVSSPAQMINAASDGATVGISVNNTLTFAGA